MVLTRGRSNDTRPGHDSCVFGAAKWAATTTLEELGYPDGDARLSAGINVGFLVADCVDAARGSVQKAVIVSVLAAARVAREAAKREQEAGR